MDEQEDLLFDDPPFWVHISIELQYGNDENFLFIPFLMNIVQRL